MIAPAIANAITHSEGVIAILGVAPLPEVPFQTLTSGKPSTTPDTTMPCFLLPGRDPDASARAQHSPLTTLRRAGGPRTHMHHHTARDGTTEDEACAIASGIPFKTY